MRTYSKKLDRRGSLDHVTMLVFASVIAVIGAVLLVISRAATPQLALDVAQPECSEISKLGHYQVGIVGVNNTTGIWSGNPCLGHEITHFDTYALYIVPNWPSGGCREQGITTPYACGKAAAAAAVRFARSRGANTEQGWWIDTEGTYWSHDISQNRWMLSGVLDQLRAMGANRVGFYSSPDEWTLITNNWKNGQPFWLAEERNQGVTLSQAKAQAGKITGFWCPQHLGSGVNDWIQLTSGVKGVLPNENIDVDFSCR